MTEVLVWMVAGAGAASIVTWLMKYPGSRLLVLVAGALAGLTGGWLLAPLFGTVLVGSGAFNLFALVTAVATAAALPVIIDLVFRRA